MFTLFKDCKQESEFEYIVKWSFTSSVALMSVFIIALSIGAVPRKRFVAYSSSNFISVL